MTESLLPFRRIALCLALVAAGLCNPPPASAQRAPARSSDFIVAVVNNELVTQFEVEQRMARAKDEAARSGAKLPPDSELRKQIINALIEERVVTTYARDSGVRVDEPELDRAVANVAAMNKIPVESLRDRLKAEGIDYTRFRDNLRDQILSERIREREVVGRIKVSDAEVDQYLEQQRTKKSLSNEINIAQILVTVPEGASIAEVLERKAKADAALARIKGGESFEAVAKAVSEDSNRERGGVMGAKAADKYPDAFVEAVQPLAVGGVIAQPLRTGAGFHILKLVSRSDTQTMTTTQTRARHILLRPSARLTPEAAAKRLSEFRAQVANGSKRFEDLARDNSEDGSAANGGDLGWTAPGTLVPEFEEAMNKLQPGGLSEPLVSRFGVHLIQVQERREVAVDPRQAREQARNVLRERKFEDAYTEWVDELRSRAYIEMREPPAVIQARKRFGQHFLTDGYIIDAIVRAIHPRVGEPLVEIGPGLGALTGPLRAECERLTVIELDRDLAAKLRHEPGLEVIESDVLRVDFAALADAKGAPLRVVGNLPYNISTPILFHLLEFADRIADQHFMLQKEVVDRMAAGPGSKTYGRLSVMLQWRYDIEAILDVPPEAFDPPPRVDSAVVRMLPLPRPAQIDRARFGALVASAFSQRRKLLRHSLGRWLADQGFDGEFDLQRRAEEVPVAEFVALAQALPPP